MYKKGSNKPIYFDQNYTENNYIDWITKNFLLNYEWLNHDSYYRIINSQRGWSNLLTNFSSMCRCYSGGGCRT